ncbi:MULTISPECIES: S8 family serine peptidase [unclassified Actinobaculum]|uniref:S8 family serine peptidase n=1 Tax=unclassified Actinobaculum TaxID=2609299 RepID=UPI000F73B2D9|nr:MULTISPECIES: S8 family serine peptidase [unclassified Actinobaculum]RTE48500.1 hypothetical protein EKN07_09025 [Actinobaculum sp. 352]
MTRSDVMGRWLRAVRELRGIMRRERTPGIRVPQRRVHPSRSPRRPSFSARGSHGRRRTRLAAAVLAAAMAMPSVLSLNAVAATEQTPRIGMPEGSRSYVAPFWFDDGTCQEGDTSILKREELEADDFVIANDTLGLPEAHELSRGGTVTIAIIDTGVQSNNPALAGARIEAGYDFTDSGSALTDHDGHGTAVASVIAGQNNGDAPIDGVAPEASIVPVKVIDSKPNSGASEEEVANYNNETRERVISGVIWAADNPSIDIIAIPLAFETDSPALKEAIAHAVGQGKLIIAAAGDATSDELVSAYATPSATESATEGTHANLRYPAAYDGVIGVTAVTATSDVSDDLMHSEAVDLAGPGTNVLVANGDAGTCLAATNAVSTGYATGFVVGAAALTMSYNNPSESPEMTAFRLKQSARRGDPSSRTDELGWGIVNPYAAMTLIDDGALPGPGSPERESPSAYATSGRAVPDPPHDMTAQSRFVGALWVAGGVGAVLVLLIFAAGRARGKRQEEDE